jgi:hypothetical protein
MASGKRKNFGCGHRGFGAYCHRCHEGKRLKAEAERSTLPGYKRTKEQEKEYRDGLLEESRRLLGPQEPKKKNGRRKPLASVTDVESASG